MELMEIFVREAVYMITAKGACPDDYNPHIWERISEISDLDTDFILKHHDHLNMDKICVYHNDFSAEELEKLHEVLNWKLLAETRLIPEDILNKYYE